MEIEKKSRSMNFLVEMLIVLLFFSLSMIVCVQLFLGASQRSELASDLSVSTLIGESVAEQLKLTPYDELSESFDGVWSNEVLTLYFDEMGNAVDAPAYFQLQISGNEESQRLTVYTVTVLRESDSKQLNQFEVGSLEESGAADHE